MGITIKFVPYIAFKPILLEITIGTKASKIKNKRLYPEKYIICELLAQYLTQIAEKDIKRITYKTEIKHFKVFPPKKLEISNKSKLGNGLSSNIIINVKIKDSILTYIILIQEPEPQ